VKLGRALLLGVVYAAGMPPAAVGTAPGLPFVVGGTGFASVPQTNNGVLPVYATPALLAAGSVTNLTIGSQAWVTNQGVWSYATTCPNTCDGANTCRTAGGLDGGSGCWLRNLNGLPGANNISNWYANSATGNDTGVALAFVVGGGIYAGTANSSKSSITLPPRARMEEAPPPIVNTNGSVFTPEQIVVWQTFTAPERRSRIVRCRDAADRVACMIGKVAP
jgi:hypothetical protein